MKARLTRAGVRTSVGWRRMLARLTVALMAFMGAGWVFSAVANAATPAHPAAKPQVTTIALPCPINPLNCIPSSVKNIFNPFQWLYDAIKGLTNDLVGLYEKVIISPPIPLKGGPLDYLFANSLGVAYTLALPITIIILVLAMFAFKLIDRALQAVIMVIGVALFLPYWYAAVDYAVTVRIQMGKALMQMSQHAGGSGAGSPLSSVSIDDILGGIIGLGSVMFWGYILVCIILVESVLIIVVEFLAPIAWVFWPLGDRAKKFLSMLISAGFVSILMGPLAAVFCLEMGKVMGTNMDFGSGIISAFWETSWLVLAIVAQIMLFISMYKWSKQKVYGSINSLSRVSGKVQTETRQRLNADINAKANAMNTTTTKAIPLGQEPTAGQRAKRAVKSEVKYQAATHIGKTLTTKVAAGTLGAATGGAALLAAGAASHIASKHKQHSISKGRSLSVPSKQRPRSPGPRAPRR